MLDKTEEMAPTKRAKKTGIQSCASSALVLCGGGERWGKYENTRAGCTSRKQIIDSWEGKKGRGLAGKLSECACFNPFTTTLTNITLKHFPE